jgi:phage terminase Nu1 subunit (DNA packaging protein)
MARAGGYTPSWTEPPRHSQPPTKAELLRRCGVARGTGDNWSDESCPGLRRDARGRYRTRWLCAWLAKRDASRRVGTARSKTRDLEAELARARIDQLRAQSQMTRAKLGKLLEGLYTADSVIAALDSLGRLVTSNLSRLPKRLAQRLESAGLKRGVIQDVVEEEIEQIAERLRGELSELHLKRPRASSIWLELGGADPELEEEGEE